MKSYLLAWLLLCATGANALGTPEAALEPRGGVRFDAQFTPSGYTLVARGRPEQPYERVHASFEEAMKELCADARVAGPPKRGEYEYLEGGSQFLMPAGGAFIPTTTYNAIRMAPSVSGHIACTAPQPTEGAGASSQVVRLAVDNKLGESVPYIDQGFASFNRERLNVPLNSAVFADVIARAVKSALAARGYNVETAAPTDREAARLVFTPSHVPGEQFEGLAMLTKIGLLGLSNLSAVFCSFEVAVAPGNAGSVKSVGAVSTRKFIPAIYSSWKQDMANGPSEEMHRKATAALSEMLETNVRAAVHALPAQTLRRLLGGQGS